MGRKRTRPETVTSLRREYFRRYYQMHRKKSQAAKREIANREVIKQAYTHSDIMKLSIEKSVRVFQIILKGQRIYTG